jgi:N-ethylmaleimide reductase
MVRPMTQPSLHDPLRVGAIDCPNRVFMAPLTRSRAGQPGDVPTALNAEYYRQRAGAGLIVSEATQVHPQGKGYAWTPGLYDDAQQEGWRAVVDAVHGAGGRIALQLWHVGRISHRWLQPGGEAPLAPSAVRADAQCFVIAPDGTPQNAPCDAPRALEASELPAIVAQYRAAARRAMAAGFDLVEVHAANGYLLNQFLATNSNQRDDDYGGTLVNRARFPLEVIDAVADACGADRVGVRLSPFGVFNDMADTEAEPMAYHLAEAFAARGLAYLHIAEPDWAGGPPLTPGFRRGLRSRFSGALVFCGGYTRESASARLADGEADAIAFGRPYIANPDLVERFRRQAALNEPDPATFYGGGAAGYTDYPAL